MRIMFKFLKSYRASASVALVFMLVELFVELWQPLIIAKIIDEGIMNSDIPFIFKWGAVMLGISLFAFFGGIINSFFAAHVSQSFAFDIRNSLYEKIQSFTYANFTRFPTSSLITRMTNDVTQLQNTVFMGLRIMMRAPLLILGSTIMAFTVNAKLALILTAVIPFLTLFLAWIMKKGGSLFQSVQVKLDGVNSVMRENLTGIRLIKAFLRRNYEGKRFSRANLTLKDETVYALRVMETVNPFLLFFMNICVLVILWLGSELVPTNGAEIGEVVAIVNYAARITSAFSPLSFIIAAFSRARASAGRMAEVFETANEMEDAEGSIHSNREICGDVEFMGVYFEYPDTDRPILQDLSFRVKAGETIAILGATGSGKSTLFQLIPRLYGTTDGNILIDGHDIRSYKQESLRKQIGFVPQEALLFTGTVKENIAWGKQDASLEEIIKAAKAAQIHQTIMKLPKQYEAVLGQKGVNLSGGQKQRLSIARALVRNPKILMLDDSTSALDLKTEAILLKSLKEYKCTTLVITQKISTAAEADSILLLEDGRLLTEGSHDSLLKNSQLYRQIFESQFGEEELEHAQRSV
ncbi:ATP-binding cassette subfamily B protein [Peribacillus deserti]|uniref:ATP-binding cassette subfamily B protein n=1 Tax=Peribacillus deserti TaxID=673318 RepID=A0ABS2QIN8_9BACI|nr:ABC transporter ATP-binding protein [Peribacillus deserti]MBM7692830.1 ATP-binding cassette subfamily B protein [Peribacillus deserti]